MMLREPAAIRARDRASAIALVWLWRTVASWLIVGPVVAALASAGSDTLPTGDAALFEPGGLMLIEAVRLGARALRMALHQAAWSFALMAALGLVPLSMLLVALASDERPAAGAWIGRALEHLPALIFIGGITLLLQGLGVLVGGLLAWAARDLAMRSLDERAVDLVTLGAASIGVLLALTAGIYADLARAVAVYQRRRARDALVIAGGVLWRRLLRALAGWMSPALWSLAAMIAGAIVVGMLHVERAGAWRLAGAALAHQGVILAIVALRAVWLAQALRLAASAPAPAA